MPDAPQEFETGGPGPHNLKFPQAFGFTVDEASLTASMQETVDTAAQVNNALRSRLNEVMMNQLAESAVFTDSLRQKIGSSLQAQVAQSQQVAGKLQQPILTTLVNDLGATIEATMPMGVTLPRPGEEAPCPPCVVIRSSALAGDLGPALECYRATALPLRDSRGMDYARAVEFIQNCLPADGSSHDAFAAAMLRLQNEPFAAGGGVAIDIDRYHPPSTPPAPAGFTSLPPGGDGRAGVLMPAAPSAPGGGEITQGNAPDCAAEMGRWAQELQQALAQCTPLQFSDPARYAACVSAAQAAAMANPPRCLGGVGTGAPPAGSPGSPGAGGPGVFDPRIPAAPPGIGPPPRPPVAPGGPIVIPGGPQPAPAPPGVGLPAPVPGVPAAPPGAPPVPAGPTVNDVQSCFAACAQTGATYQECFARCSSQLQIPIAPSTPSGQCDTGWTKVPVFGNAAEGVSYVCVKLPTPTTPPAPPSTQCCPSPPIVINVPPCPPPVPPAPMPAPAPPPARIPEVPPMLAVNAQQIAGCTEFPPIPQVNVAGGFGDFSKMIGLRRSDGSINVPALDDDPTGIVTGIVKALVGVLATETDQLFGLINAVARQTGCASGENLQRSATAALLEFASRFVGSALDAVRIPNEQVRNYLCPVNLPSAAQAGAAWLGNTIDHATLECWVRAAGERFPEFERVIDASRQKLQALQIGALQMRGHIDMPTLATRIRELGFTRPGDTQDVLNLLKQIPPPTDIVRFMVRDTFDPNIVNRFDLDAQFGNKFAGKLVEWATAQGVDTEYMRAVWRAHWTIPAPGQLANMLHRLSRRPAGDPAAVDLETVRSALVQQDIAPFWVDKYIAISYAPLTRIDSRRAFEIGVLDKAGLKEAYLNLGYSNESADTLVEFNTKNVKRGFYRRPEVQQYAKGIISDQDFEKEMQRWGATTETIAEARDRAATLRRVEANKRCLSAFRKRFLLGDFDGQRAIALVHSRGQTLEAATEIVEGWKCEADAQGKEFTFSQLNALYEAGIIDELEYVQRAVRLHYDQDEAVKLLRLTQRRLNIKATKLQADQLRQEQANADKLAKELMRQANRDESARAKRVAAIAKARGVGVLREKRILAAAAKFSQHAGLPIEDAIPQVKSVVRTALEQHATTWDEVIAALTVIAGDESVTTLPALVNALAVALTAPASESLTTLP